jgi:predicted DNA-binding protein
MRSRKHWQEPSRDPASIGPIAARPVSGMRVRAEDVVLVSLIEVIPGYTEGMKTAISLPDDTYEQATRQAQALGISRSEFFARAARSYLDQLTSRSLTQQIDEALRTGDDDSNAAAAAAGRSYLAGQDDW